MMHGASSATSGYLRKFRFNWMLQATSGEVVELISYKQVLSGSTGSSRFSRFIAGESGLSATSGTVAGSSGSSGSAGVAGQSGSKCYFRYSWKFKRYFKVQVV